MYINREWRFYILFGQFKRVENYLLMMYGKFLTKKIKGPVMREKLRPTFKLGCKRILISDEYYDRMNDSNFKLDNTAIIEINENGIRTAEKEHQLDIIVYATGFLLKENYDFITKPNKAIDEQWQGPTRTYYGTFHPKAPNFATFLGPMTGLGHNSIIFMIECQAQLLINALREMWDNKGFLQFVVVQARKSGL